MPKVSVIVPCYGVEKYLDRCMESLVNQTLKDIEIILVDDVSPDRVPEMCDEWAKKDSRIRVIHKEKNGGLGFARNSGLDIATGEYVAFVDSDDFVELDMYEKLYREAMASDADVVFSSFYSEQSNGQWIKTSEVTKREVWSGNNTKDFYLRMVGNDPKAAVVSAYQMSVWHSIYRRDIIENLSGMYDSKIRFHSEREVLSEDLPFQMDFLIRAKKIVYIEDAFYHYCLNGASLTNTFDVSKFARMNNLFHLLSDQLKEVEDAQEHVDYFYINYSRARIQDLMRSNVKDKRKYIKQACNDLKKFGITRRYSSNILKTERRMFYNLMRYDQILLIQMLCRIIYWKRRLKGDRI